jgi:hypothetical protein
MIKAAPVNFDDSLFELVPEVYIDSRQISEEKLAQGVDDLIRETAAYIIRFRRERNES